MWLKLYIGKLFLDKVEVDFDGMETAKERERHLEMLARELYEENKVDIIRSKCTPSVFIHKESSMNQIGFRSQTWREIIESVGSEKAKANINDLAHELTYIREKGIIEL